MEDVFKKFPRLDIEVAVLRELDEKDTKNFFKYMTDEHVKKFIAEAEVPTSLAVAESDIIYWKSLFVKRSSIFWAIAEKHHDQIIGSCGFNYWNKSQGRVELSYDLNYNFWGKGIMTRAVAAVTDFALEKMKVNRIQATVAIDNERSIKLLEKCGYEREGVIKNYFKLQDKIKDGYMYSNCGSSF